MHEQLQRIQIAFTTSVVISRHTNCIYNISMVGCLSPFDRLIALSIASDAGKGIKMALNLIVKTTRNYDEAVTWLKHFILKT